MSTPIDPTRPHHVKGSTPSPTSSSQPMGKAAQSTKKMAYSFFYPNTSLPTTRASNLNNRHIDSHKQSTTDDTMAKLYKGIEKAKQ